jgi:hypothetical protein
LKTSTRAAVVGLGLLDQGDQVSDQFRPDEIQRRRRYRHEKDAAFAAHGQRLKRPEYLLRLRPVVEPSIICGVRRPGAIATGFR